MHDDNGGVIISWKAPTFTEVPILYYKMEYRSELDDEWQMSTPVLANKTTMRFVPSNIDEDTVIKYYFRVRSYALLAYSDYTEAKRVYFPSMYAYYTCLFVAFLLQFISALVHF